MSCPDGSCMEPSKRRWALLMFGLMMLVFIVLSGFSFVKSRGQVMPGQIAFGPHRAGDGKRVFQAYNCMDCHTIVGNGAYLAPDLTKEYERTGPAWLAAFLPSAGGWPTEGALRVKLMDPQIAAAAGVDTLEAYYEKYPGAKERVERRGGGTTLMPNLPFSSDEVGQLIAFMKYTSAMNTEGWPPKVETGPLDRRLSLVHAGIGFSTATLAPTPITAAAAEPQTLVNLSPIERGAKLVKAFGCTACHASDGKRLVGPGWGGLFGSQVKLADGTSVVADDEFLRESILDPNAKLVDGYAPNTMASYRQLLTDDDVNCIIEYIRTLERP